MLKSLDSIDLSANVEFTCGLEKVLDGWVLLITSEDQFSLLLPMVSQYCNPSGLR